MLAGWLASGGIRSYRMRLAQGDVPIHENSTVPENGRLCTGRLEQQTDAQSHVALMHSRTVWSGLLSPKLQAVKPDDRAWACICLGTLLEAAAEQDACAA